MTQPELLLHSKQVSYGATSDTLHTSVHAKYCCYCLYQVNHAFTTKYFNKSDLVDVDSTHVGSTTASFFGIFHRRTLQQIGSGLFIASIGHGNS